VILPGECRKWGSLVLESIYGVSQWPLINIVSWGKVREVISIAFGLLKSVINFVSQSGVENEELWYLRV
jgi:hypothetical protein